MSDLRYSLVQLNQLSDADAAFAFSNCCTAQRWIEGMVAARPFSSKEQCLQAAEQVWAKLDEADYLQAFEGHPKIGDVSSLKAKYAHTKELASGEQSSVNEACDEVIERLAQGNHEYHKKNGFIFIVCATGKSAAEMLELLEQRLPNSREQELVNAAAEQAKITAIRLNKLLPEEA
ncbi:2-oxo-4-hydroxy-4-carboxy-5-ureidoimidazoline decarboxylase [Bacterioplanoides pacificum]|uniref:2-oxo-4-hydroxy-4-carboxy-5-ureidoimidazoline decarboxylase n=1 Tax=Bacterioplanoides pacificum TaxID=1171596 RepID=A0ABV7VM68_9GAMM